MAEWGDARIPDLDIEAATAQIDALDTEVEKYVGGLDYRYSAAYASRAHMRFAVGAPAVDVLDDFWMAARCLAANPGMHLSRHAPEQLMTRRITPVELGLLGGQIDLAKRLAAGYGLPLAVGRAGLANRDMETELRILSPGLMGEKLTHPQHLLGLAAAVYAGCLASAVRGYADEVRMGLRMLATAQYEGELSPAHRGVMVRYSGLCEVLLELIQPGERHLSGIIADQIERYTGQMRQALGEAYTKPTAPRRYADTGALGLLALATLAGYPLGEFPPAPEVTPHATVYTEFVAAMAAGRVEPEPGEDANDEEGG